MKTEIAGRTYSLEILPVGPLVAADLTAKGYNPTYFIATGKRGAVFLALRVTVTGMFVRA